jgi:hypothetical protein
MTNLENFLNKKLEVKDVPIGEPASGSFTCQHEDCNEVVYDGVIDRSSNRLTWTCTLGHHSSVVI